MQRQFGSVTRPNGQAVAFADVLVKTYPGLAVASLFEVDGITAAANPVRCDSHGNYAYSAADGAYQETVSGASILTYTKPAIVLSSGSTVDVSSLSTGLSTAASGITSLSTGLSTTAGGTTSLSTGLSTANSNVTSLSTSTSTGLSTATSGVTSLSTGLSTTNSSVTSLSTGLNTTNSSVTSLSTGTSTSVASLSTAIGGGGVTQTVGTFTPVLSGATIAGVGTYDVQSGTYVKTGRSVAFTLLLSATSHTGTGAPLVTGFPFATSTGLQFTYAANVYGFGAVTDNSYVVFYHADTEAGAILNDLASGISGQISLPGVALSPVQIYLSGSYITD